MDYLYISIVVLFIHGCSGQVNQLVPPTNEAILATGNVEFRCRVQQNTGLTSFINWDECITEDRGAGCRRISKDGNVQYVAGGGDPVRAERYSVSTGSTGEYNLNIAGAVLTEDAGSYVCRADNSAAFLGYAELIILDGAPVCSRNTTNANEAEQGHYIRHVCEASYRGRWAPIMTWDEAGIPINDVKDESETNIARYSITFEVTPQHNGNIYGTRVFFQTPSDTTDNEATNAPSYSYNFQFEPLTVFFGPYDMTIDWDEGCMAVGTHVTCNALGNPAPTYLWRDVNTTDIVSNDKTLTLTEDMLGHQTYKCEADNGYGQAEEVINIQVCTTTTTTTTTVPPTTTVVLTTVETTTPLLEPTKAESGPGDPKTLSPAAIGGICAAAVVIVIVIIVILVCCCRGKDSEKQQKANETRPKPVHGPDVIRNPETTPPKNNMMPDPYERKSPFPEEKVGHDPSLYNDPYKRAGPYDVEVPPYEDVDDRKNRNVENLTYADLALEDIPRSRKPIQVLDPTEYAEIRMDGTGRPEVTAPYPSPRHDNVIGNGMHPPSPSFRKRPQRQHSNSPSRSTSRTPSRNNSNASFTRELSLPAEPLDRSDSIDSNTARREPLMNEFNPQYPNGYDAVDIPIPKPRPPKTKPQPSPRTQRSLDRGRDGRPPRSQRSFDEPERSPRSQRSMDRGAGGRSPQGQTSLDRTPGSRSPGRSPFAPTLSQNAMNELEFRLNNPVYGANHMSEV